MKDPCLKCLVRVTCWQECDDKRNYATLLSNAIKLHTPGGLPRPDSYYQKQFRHYLNLTEEHLVKRSQIIKRASLMSKDK